MSASRHQEQLWALLLALISIAFAVPVQANVAYLHTDIQGTVVLETDQNRNVVQRFEYEPYGLPRQTMDDRPGYTGHVHDADSGLVYMQQRYYDPEVGRFLSIDPVGVNAASGANFNRYWYANNNPYTNVDLDGRAACPARDRSCIDSPRTESGTERQPPPTDEQRNVDRRVVAAGRAGRLTDGTNLDLNGDEQGFKASGDGTFSNPMQTSCQACSDGTVREVGSYNVAALAPGESGGHTHTVRTVPLPGPEDGRLAQVSGTTAYIISSDGTFAVESTPVGFRVRILDGNISAAQRNEIRRSIGG